MKPIQRRSTLINDGLRADNDSAKNEVELVEKRTNESNQKPNDDHNSSLNNSKIEIEGGFPHSPRKHNHIIKHV